MAFKASKKRGRREPKPVGRGTQIIPSAAIESWYRSELAKVTKAMIAEYKTQLGYVINGEPAQRLFATDATATADFTRTLNSLKQRWGRIFAAFADKIAPQFVEKTDVAATSATLHSLSVAGVNQPRATFNEAVKNTLQASVDYNHTLITNLSVEVHEKIYSSVMLSLTSPNPEEQGSSGIQNALKEVGGFSDKRIDLIVRDQTSKLYSSLSDDRMRENGCEEFEWMHSSAGKVPRHTHVEKDGQIFKLNDPRLWEGPKADQGPPGWAINCRCRKIPIFR